MRSRMSRNMIASQKWVYWVWEMSRGRSRCIARKFKYWQMEEKGNIFYRTSLILQIITFYKLHFSSFLFHHSYLDNKFQKDCSMHRHCLASIRACSHETTNMNVIPWTLNCFFQWLLTPSPPTTFHTTQPSLCACIRFSFSFSLVHFHRSYLFHYQLFSSTSSKNQFHISFFLHVNAMPFNRKVDYIH